MTVFCEIVLVVVVIGCVMLTVSVHCRAAEPETTAQQEAKTKYE